MQIPNWMKLSLKPDLHLAGYLKRWWILPRNKWINIYLHCFEGNDDDRALHDHPWPSVSFLLWGQLWEEYEKDIGEGERLKIFRGIVWFLPYFRAATHSHLMSISTKKAWTMFCTGPRQRDWGFWEETEDDPVWTDHTTFLDKYGPPTSRLSPF